MIECPDMFRMGDKYILFYCPQYRDNEKDIPLKSFSVYKVIDLDETTGEIDDKNLDENYFMVLIFMLHRHLKMIKKGEFYGRGCLE